MRLAARNWFPSARGCEMGESNIVCVIETVLWGDDWYYVFYKTGRRRNYPKPDLPESAARFIKTAKYAVYDYCTMSSHGAIVYSNDEEEQK